MSVLLTLTEKIVDGFFATIPRPKPTSQRMDKALLIAHRGAHNNSMGIFENTHKAFQRAKEMGCWGIELDVHSTADGVFVVNHDPNLSRLWQHNAVIADLNFDELRRLAPEIPSLSEVVKEYGGLLHLFIELKAPVLNQQTLLETLGCCEPVTNYHLLTLNPSLYDGLDQLPKRALLLVAVHNNVAAFCDLSIKKQYGGVLGNYLLLTNKQQKKLQQANQATGVGFINSKNSLYREVNRDMIWLFTNEAQRVSHHLKDIPKI
jgi:glycerophosphoryl diester phosphodiesterase